jgi:hypothetical protein
MPTVSIDFSGLAQLIVNALVTGVQTILSPLPVEFEQWLWESINKVMSSEGNTNVLFNIPRQLTTDNGAVLDLWRRSLVPQVAVGGLVLAIGGIRVMAKKDDLWHVILRYGFLAGLGITCVRWSGFIFDAINAAVKLIGDTPLDMRAETMPNDIVLGAVLIIALFFALLAWIKGAIGTVFIMALLASAGFLIPVSALPMLDRLGIWWATEFTKWSLRPFMVALVTHLGLSLATTFGGPEQVLFAVASFWLAFKMDTYMQAFSVGVWGQASNLNLFTRGAQMISGVATGGATTAAQAAGATTGAVARAAAAGAAAGASRSQAAAANP